MPKYIHTREIDISKESKTTIIEELVQYGISKEFLFPEQENYVYAIER